MGESALALLNNQEGAAKIAAWGAAPVRGAWSKLTSVVECAFTNLVQLSEGKLSKMETAKNMASCWWEKKVSDDELKDEI